MLASSLVGTGFGLLLGACVGFALSGRLPPPVSSEARVSQLIACGAVTVGFLVARSESWLVGSSGLPARFLSWVQTTTVVDATLVALVLALGAGFRRRPRPSVPAIRRKRR